MSDILLYMLAIIAIFSVGALMGYLVRVAFDREDYDGVMRVTHGENGRIFSLELEKDPDDLELEDKIVFKVLPSG